MKKIESNLVKKADAKAPVKGIVADAKSETKPPVKLTPKAAPAPVKSTTPAETKGPDRPKLPADFCLDKSDWESNSACFDANSKQCKACQKDFPETAKACSARTDFLKLEVKAVKARKASSGAVRKTASGIAPQTKIIDDGLLAKLSKADIITNLAKAHYGGEDAAQKSLATKRFDRHLKSIKDGSYVRAATVVNCIAYLTKKADEKPAAAAPAPKAPAPKAKK
jgi:hypothetical protein